MYSENISILTDILVFLITHVITDNLSWPV